MGTPSFAVPVLEGLIRDYDVLMVVCQPDKKKDRKGNIEYPATKRVALANNIVVPFEAGGDITTHLLFCSG